MKQFIVNYGRDERTGQWWWKLEDGSRYGGPFDSKEAAERDSEIVLLGAACKVINVKPGHA